MSAEVNDTDPDTARARLRQAVIGAQRAGLSPDTVLATVAPLWAPEPRDEPPAEIATPDFTTWVAEWLEANLTYEVFRDQPDEEIAARLHADLQAADWRVFKVTRVPFTGFFQFGATP